MLPLDFIPLPGGGAAEEAGTAELFVAEGGHGLNGRGTAGGKGEWLGSWTGALRPRRTLGESWLFFRPHAPSDGGGALVTGRFLHL
jgi:hypothetical protein